MSAASHLRLPVTATAVPEEMSYHVPAPSTPARQRSKPRKQVKPAFARWLSPTLSIGICAGICLAVGLGLVAQKARLMALNYELIGLQTQLAELEKQHEQLKLALVTAQSPGRVEQVARERLGMAEPEHVEYLVLAGASNVQNELPEATKSVASSPGPIAKLGSWLNGNWPRWGTAEASPKP